MREDVTGTLLASGLKPNPHLALTLNLLRLGLHLSIPAENCEVSNADWQAVIDLADYNHVLPTVARGIEALSAEKSELKALSAFFQEFRAAEVKREESLCNEICDLCECLNGAGVPPLLLKGACFLGEANLKAVGWRFMSDVDILIRPYQLDSAIKALKYFGYSNEKIEYSAEDDQHYPALSRRGSLAAVEIHTRLLGEPTKLPIDTDAIFARARLTDTGSAKFFLPSPEDRMIHLIAHGAIANHQHRRRHIILREALDFFYLSKSFEINLGRLYSIFRDAGHEAEFCAFIAIMSFTLGQPFGSPDWQRQNAQWMSETIEALARPRKQAYWIARDNIRLALSLVATRKGQARLVRILSNPSRLKFFIVTRLNNLRQRF